MNFLKKFNNFIINESMKSTDINIELYNDILFELEESNVPFDLHYYMWDDDYDKCRWISKEEVEKKIEKDIEDGNNDEKTFKSLKLELYHHLEERHDESIQLDLIKSIIREIVDITLDNNFQINIFISLTLLKKNRVKIDGVPFKEGGFHDITSFNSLDLFLNNLEEYIEEYPIEIVIHK